MESDHRTQYGQKLASELPLAIHYKSWFLVPTFTARVPSQSISRSAPVLGVHVLSLVVTL